MTNWLANKVHFEGQSMHVTMTRDTVTVTGSLKGIILKIQIGVKAEG